MNKTTASAFALLASLASISTASAANRYLYFMFSEGGSDKVFNVSMEPVYNRVLRNRDNFACVYKNAQGMTAQFAIEPAQCGSESASLTMAITGKTTEGRKIESSSFQVYVDHKYILMGGELSGLVDNANPFSASVASAGNYGKMSSEGSELPPIATVPTVGVTGTAIQVETLAPGTMGCWLEHREYFCR